MVISQIAFSHPTKIGGFKISGFNGTWVQSLKVYFEDNVGRMHFAKSLPEGSEVSRIAIVNWKLVNIIGRDCQESSH